MGVPKFYRWISERYPLINQVITDSALLPEFDHLYLDMNGIIHGCTHPAHLDISTKLTERDMMMGIMHYIDRIITQIVKPKVSVFMAIDGVAPRAKLNQQRSRRFRSAKDMAEATMKERVGVDKGLFHDEDKAGDVLGGSGGKKGTAADSKETTNDTGDYFDSNCITPGTEFMARVSSAIKYFIRQKLKHDPTWQKLRVIFSGHEIPGEGEHKIMEHLRQMRCHPDYTPNTRHCMYGQDADLIMLGLVSHEPHFTLLREIVDFSFSGGKGKNTLKTVKKFTKESDFQLLHLSILREYLQIEFCNGLDPDTYDLERIVDDFVFMTFLVGNDFLPHLPALDIGDGAFDLVFDTYRKQRPTWGVGVYMTYRGEIVNAKQLEAFLKVIGAAESEILEKREENDAEFLAKKRRWDKRDGVSTTPSDKELAEKEKNSQTNYASMMESVLRRQLEKGEEFVEGYTRPPEGKKDFKGRYYYEKLGLTPLDKREHLDLRRSYVEGLLWCLAYYYKGCVSWGWFFPYHYGPMLSDLTNLPDVISKIKFSMGQPLKPFEQLMGCLPPASSVLVPPPYRKLMTSTASPIIQFYPTDFQIDMNGKRNPWEGVNLLPFIDVKLLKDTIAAQCPDRVLTPDERCRNTLGSVYLYTFDLTSNETVPSFNRELGFQDITQSHSRVTTLDVVDPTAGCGLSFEPKLVPGTQIPYPGFPSLNVLPIASKEQTPMGLNCFGSPSKYPNTVLHLHQMPELPGAEELAEQIIGKHLFINYPMMHEAKVVGISDGTCEVTIVKKKKKVNRFATDREGESWQSTTSLIAQTYFVGNGTPGTGGIQIGPIQIRLKLKPLQGMRTNPADGSTKKVFGKEEADVPLQMCLWNAPAPDPRFMERGPQKLRDLFPVGCNVLLTKGKYKGCLGTVLDAEEQSGKKKGEVVAKVRVIPPEPPFGLAIARSVQESYLSTSDAAKVLKMHPTIFSRIVGSISCDPGRYDLGLNLRYREDMCVPGYSRKRELVKAKGGKGYNVKNQNGQGKKKNDAWTAGDSLRVIGNRHMSSAEQPRNRNDYNNQNGGRGGGNREDNIAVWEFTPKAIRLVAAYRQQYPQLFAALTRQPNEKFYNARQLFGPNGDEMLPKVREWLNGVETAKVPRAPTTTIAMPVAAIAAVQRAAEVRRAALEAAQGKEVKIRVPPSALYRAGSTSATDVVAQQDGGVGPQLGDRIANMCANGVPFGLRGTVVSVHQALHGCVEVVMDEEFIGGSNLQGACANFRGKLCVWAHLLKISAADSVELVDQIVPPLPTAVKEAAESTPQVERVAAQEQKQAKASASAKSSKGPRPDGAAPVVTKPPQSSPPQLAPPAQKPGGWAGVVATTKASTPATASSSQQMAQDAAPVKIMKRESTPSSSDSQPPPPPNAAEKGGRSRTPSEMRRSKTPTESSRASFGSPKRGKQGAWKEALGPVEGTKGFNGRGAKGGIKNGYKAWKQYISSGKTKQQATTVAPTKTSTLTSSSGDASAGLKALLGVTPNGAQSAPTTGSVVRQAAPLPTANPTLDLKAALGLAPAPSGPPFAHAVAPMPPAPQPPTPVTAADALMKLMISGDSSTNQQSAGMMPAPSMQPAFNFTYVKEGENEKKIEEPVLSPPPALSIPPHYSGAPVIQAGMLPFPPPPGVANPMMMSPGTAFPGYPPMGYANPAAYGPVPTYAPVNDSRPVPRAKKSGKKSKSTSSSLNNIVPAAVVTKTKSGAS